MTTVRPIQAPQNEFAVRPLPAFRVNVMRVGYLVMGLGLVVYKWPLILQAASFPVWAGVVVCVLVAMSLFALLGLRYPVRMMPVLLFESVWKLVWLGAVAVPQLVAGSMDPVTEEIYFSVLWVVIIIAVTPWDYAWKCYVMAPGDRWRRRDNRSGREASRRLSPARAIDQGVPRDER